MFSLLIPGRLNTTVRASFKDQKLLRFFGLVS